MKRIFLLAIATIKLVSCSYKVKSLKDVHHEPYCPKGKENQDLCNNWQDIEPGFCDAVSNYEVYSFQDLDRQKFADSIKPQTMQIKVDETTQRNFTFSFCQEKYDLDKERSGDNKKSSFSDRMLLGNCSRGMAYLSKSFKNDQLLNNSVAQINECEYATKDGEFRPAYYNHEKNWYEGYQIMFSGQNDLEKEYTVMFDVQCGKEDKIIWTPDNSIKDANFAVFHYRGKQGCIYKEFYPTIIYNQIKAALIQGPVGVYLLFMGSVKQNVTLFLITALLCIGVTFIVGQGLHILDVSSLDIEMQIIANFACFFTGILLAIVVYMRWIRHSKKKPKLQAQLSTIQASITFCYFIVGPIQVPMSIKVIMVLCIIAFGSHAFKNFQKFSVTFGSAVIGAGNLLISVSYYVEGLPPLFPLANTKLGTLHKINIYFLIYQIAFTLLTFAGFCYQHKQFNKYHKDDIFRQYYN